MNFNLLTFGQSAARRGSPQSVVRSPQSSLAVRVGQQLPNYPVKCKANLPKAGTVKRATFPSSYSSPPLLPLEVWAIGIAGSSTCSGCAHKSMLKSNSTRSFICPLVPAHHFRLTEAGKTDAMEMVSAAAADDADAGAFVTAIALC